ncbi:MAG: hypothetical protein WKF55_15575 [Gemmatimonadaceae bacterium]
MDIGPGLNAPAAADLTVNVAICGIRLHGGMRGGVLAATNAQRPE